MKGGVQEARMDADPEEVERALAAVRADTTFSRLFSDGAHHPDGQVDRSLTEFHLVAFLKERGFSEAAAWAVARQCQHTKSPSDLRGFPRFRDHVWRRLAPAPLHGGKRS